jgi:uncharacterized protein YndB with AHSA1/START domain
MTVRKDDSGRRWVELEYVVPGTPEQVWDAVATGPGMAAWWTEATVDEFVGGTVTFHFGCMGSSSGPVTGWEPPQRFSYEEVGWSGDAPPVATEVTVTARSGDGCVVRIVHSLFTDRDDWDDELESFENGWPAFFAVLRLYLRHFAGLAAATGSAMVPFEGDPRAVWAGVCDSLNLTGAGAGDHRSAPEDAPSLSGELELVHQDRENRYVIITLDEPGVVMLGTHGSPDAGVVQVSVFGYGSDAAERVAAAQSAWAAWLPDRVQTLT